MNTSLPSFAHSRVYLPELRTYVRQVSRLQEAGASPRAAAIVQEFQADSWFTVGKRLAIVESGTRPGDALADIIFSFLFAAVLRKVREALVSKGFQVWLPWSDSWHRNLQVDSNRGDDALAPIDVSWMDDLALLLTAGSTAELVEAVRGTECLRAMLHPNLDPGKTEASWARLAPFAFLGSQSSCSVYYVARGTSSTCSLIQAPWGDSVLDWVACPRAQGPLCTGMASLPQASPPTLAATAGEKLDRAIRDKRERRRTVHVGAPRGRLPPPTEGELPRGRLNEKVLRISAELDQRGGEETSSSRVAEVAFMGDNDNTAPGPQKRPRPHPAGGRAGGPPLRRR